ncbi:MAG TPA: DinB family protein [Bacteroidia bacterium]|jgi:uncharacterized damage-inducible protein DinB|nr:DinB family protein [Bacteroidia bacterium]HQF27805.1 DinB family protein [Bacteroidia bacterium]HQK97079.1 DinB family protein [Bacteroidia bacterium]
MSLKNLISNYAAFNEWANTEIVTWLKTLDKELLYKKTASSYPSIDYTLQHILRGQKFWFLFITGQDTSNFNWSVYEGEVERIMEDLLTSSAAMKQTYSAFSEQELLEVLNLEVPWAKNSRSRYDYIVHIINHGSFHRGQIVTMARSIGVTEGIVNTDYNIFNCL